MREVKITCDVCGKPLKGESSSPDSIHISNGIKLIYDVSDDGFDDESAKDICENCTKDIEAAVIIAVNNRMGKVNA